MIIAFQIILLLIIVVSFMAIVADESEKFRGNMTAVCIASIAAFIVSILWL